MMRRPIKLCIIDDIRSVVEMISLKIDWHAHGIEVVGSALDGDEGLLLVQKESPDIIVTDIRMPKMDGLEMTRRILEFLPQSKIIILSAYTDFSYVQQALRLGAFDFVKKPFSIDEILRLVLKAKVAWEQDERELTKIVEMEKKIKESMPVLRQEYLNLLMHHQTDEVNARMRWEFLDIDLKPQNFVVFIVEIDQFSDKYQAQFVQSIELIRFSLQNIMEETITSFTKGTVFREALNRYVCIINCTDNDKAAVIAEVCCVNIAQFTRFTVSIGVGLEVSGIHELPLSYRQALNALSYHFYTNGNGIFSFMNISTEQSGVSNYSIIKEQDFLFALRSGNKVKSQMLLEAIFNDLVEIVPLPEPKYVENVCYELSSKIIRVMLEKFPYTKVSTLEYKINDIKNGDPPSLKEFRNLLNDLCLESCGWIEKERSYESTKIIHQAKDYISANLHLDVNLEHCAKQVNLSAGYFSNLFKKVSGISFQQFVMQQKMEKVKAMLIEDFQVQEIAEKLGYEHRRYLTDVFKKYSGMTPSEYKESFLGRSSES
ncbi:MAG: AraC family transcriptional regulator [Bacilli bacterium]|nr:AraC family transcriptional regulator [Bacilli bacterium]